MTQTGARGRLEIIASVALAVVVFLVLRQCVWERYLVPSPSMEPTLHGDPQHGDRVLVNKTAYWWDSPSPGDLVVLAPRQGSNPLVKRMVAEGPVTLALREGDLFVDRGDGGGLQREVKQPSLATDSRAFAWRFRPGDPFPTWVTSASPEALGFEEGELHLAASSDDLDRVTSSVARQKRLAHSSQPEFLLPGHLSLAASVDSSFLTCTGERMAQSRHYPRDIGMSFSVLPAKSCTKLHLVLEHRGRYYGIEWSREGALRFVSDDQLVAEVSVSPWPVASEWSGSFGYLDGHLFLLLGGETIFYQPWALEGRDSRLRLPGDDPTPFVNNLHLGVLGGACRIRTLEVFHDFYYPPLREEPFRLEEGEIFVLGDNSLFSEDSRELRNLGSVPYRLSDVIGRPMAIIAPSSRRQWLPRPVTGVRSRDN